MLQLFDKAIYRLIVYFTFHCFFTSEIANIIAGEKKLNNSNEGVYKLSYHNVLFANYQLIHK